MVSEGAGGGGAWVRAWWAAPGVHGQWGCAQCSDQSQQDQGGAVRPTLHIAGSIACGEHISHLQELPQWSLHSKDAGDLSRTPQ